MTPDEVRRQIKGLDDAVEGLRSPKGELETAAASMLAVTIFDLIGVQILEAIAEGRCTDPQICAREFTWHRKQYWEQREIARNKRKSRT